MYPYRDIRSVYLLSNISKKNYDFVLKNQQSMHDKLSSQLKTIKKTMEEAKKYMEQEKQSYVYTMRYTQLEKDSNEMTELLNKVNENFKILQEYKKTLTRNINTNTKNNVSTNTNNNVSTNTEREVNNTPHNESHIYPNTTTFSCNLHHKM